ncbi:hypothetical protein C0W54_21360 [Photobacterium kishitanii]|nr:hypothetical protein AYY23_17330 [Photobacterium kishitanii]PSV14364.1 hypothetical protein C0W59_15315 [Photobacterium kishitanii]PSW45463.1 hypothetical protein C0W66_22670 [Photobacterium kishitanii]PSW58345.1 hypothetical protein C0W54_21360 [Photobacterium kishitanii]
MEIVTVLTYKNNYIYIMVLNNDYARGKKMHICKWYLMAANVVTTRLIKYTSDGWSNMYFKQY